MCIVNPIDMCIDMYIDMCIDMCIDVCIDMCTFGGCMQAREREQACGCHVCLCSRRFVAGHLYTNVPVHFCSCVCVCVCVRVLVSVHMHLYVCACAPVVTASA